MDNSGLRNLVNKQLELNELKIIIKNKFSFDRSRMIFFTLNSCLFGLAFFSMFSAITLESNAQIFRIRSYLADDEINALNTRLSARKLETILIPQNLAQLCTIISAIIGYFGVYQKSRKILHIYPLALGISLVFRLIATIIIVSYYSTIENVFDQEVGTFVTLEIVFLVFDFLFTYLAFVQFRKASTLYNVVQGDRNRLITDNNMAYELIKKIVKN
ncbi:hypothetical protein pb186bvf_016395 [Paramecium bursaria]